MTKRTAKLKELREKYFEQQSMLDELNSCNSAMAMCNVSCAVLLAFAFCSLNIVAYFVVAYLVLFIAYIFAKTAIELRMSDICSEYLHECVKSLSAKRNVESKLKMIKTLYP